jgi:hypothetical protein
MPTTLTPIKILGKIKKDNSKAAIAARKALVNGKPLPSTYVSKKGIGKTKGSSSQTPTSSNTRSYYRFLSTGQESQDKILEEYQV